MDNVWSNLVTESLGGIVNSIGSSVDNLVTSEEEKLAMKNELVRLQLEHTIELHKRTIELEQEVSTRWVSDNEHWLTRLIRPAIVAWIFFLFTVVILLDGNLWGFTINQSYIPMLETTLQTAVITYFSGRSVEKGIRIHNEYRKVNQNESY